MNQSSTGNSPWSDDSATIGNSVPERACTVCGCQFVSIGRRIYCSVTCKHLAYRRRHQGLASSAVVAWGNKKPRRSVSVYQCPSCGMRELGIQLL